MNMIKTELISIDPQNIQQDKLSCAAEIIRNGGLVAFPTETVYGLGADAMNEKAVLRIFEAKGRPSDNPLIVHVSSADEVPQLVQNIPEQARLLIDRFWPGPLTLVMKKSPAVPLSVTAGLDTVAVRMPSHPVALSLIKSAGVPIAAPSANRSGKPSPTAAAHVIEDLTGRVEAIIDAGSCNVGVESTVLDITNGKPIILRPGGVTHEQLRTVLGEVSLDPALLGKVSESVKPKSPGMKYRHYAPKAQVIVIEGDINPAADKIHELYNKYTSEGYRVGIMATDETQKLYPVPIIISAGSRKAPETIASSLFSVFREFDSLGVDIILSESVNTKGIGLAIMNRLKKAAGNNIIKV